MVYSNQIFKTKDQFFYSCKHKKNTTHFTAFPGQKTFSTFGPGSCLVSHSQYHAHILSSFVFSSTHISYKKFPWYLIHVQVHTHENIVESHTHSNDEQFENCCNKSKHSQHAYISLCMWKCVWNLLFIGFCMIVRAQAW